MEGLWRVPCVGPPLSFRFRVNRLIRRDRVEVLAVLLREREVITRPTRLLQDDDLVDESFPYLHHFKERKLDVRHSKATTIP